MKKITNYVLMITAALLLSFVPLHSSAQCNYSVSLYDTWGDGWNGGNLDVMVNGSVVLDNLTLASGTGPLTYFFAVNTGNMITTDYTAGMWSSENYYRIFNSSGVQVFGTPAGSTPTDLVPPGVTAACPPPVGNVMGHVYNGDGVAIAGADVTVDGFGFRTTDATGAYSFLGLPAGATDMTASKDGWNDVTQTVTVISSNTVTADFTLTQPSLTINPLMYDEVLNPNEYLTKFLGMLNIGDGPAGWTAEVVYPETNNSNNLTERQAELNAMTSHGAASIQDATNTTQTISDRDYTTCPDGSIFSNPPVGTDNGYTSILYSGYYCAQQFTTSAAIGSVTVWALYSGAQPQDFKVDFYADGSAPGALLNSYTVTGISGLNTGIVLYGFPMYQFTIPVPSTSLASGYVSVVAQLGNSPWYWSNTYSGTGNAFQMVGGSWLALAPSKLAVCLGPASGGGGGAGDWLTLGQYEGEVGPNGTSFNLPVNFDATGTAAGEVYNAEIHITTDPNVGTFTVPVTMTIYGDPLSPVTDLTATLTNEVTGAVSLSWTFTRPANFQYFLIKRDGLGIGTTTNTSYSDILPGYDTYCYTVTPVYDAGNGVPGGPACLDWLIPVLCYSPAAPENSQWPLTQEEVGLTIENCGQGTLEFSFPDYAAQLLLNNPNIQKNDVSPVEGFDKIAEPAKGETDPRDGGGHPVVLGAGGPDTFGYEWIDSQESGGPVYNWVEISGTGTNHGLVGDDNYSTITLPFEFPFYGVDKTSLLASTNGYLTFGSSGSDYSNDGIPNANTPNDIIAAFWDDLNFVSGTSFLYSYYDAANSRFIIEYKNVPRLGASVYNTFQYILTPNGGITIQYQSMNGTLNSATTGIENASGNDGLQVAYNTAYVANNLAVYFFQPAHFITSVNPYYGTISEGNSQEITMVYSSADYGVGTYTEDLYISTNEQGTNEWFIPNTMHVYQPASISGTVTDCVTGAPKKNVTVTANPLSAINQWLYYDDGNSIDAIGGPATFSWAIKFDPAQLAGLDGTSLTKIMLYNYVTSAGELRIYKGANAATLLHTQTLSGQTVGTWSEINLNSAVALDVTQELWITIYTTVGATWPASCGAATGQPNGDLITLDGVTWDHLTDYGLPYTWSLRGFVTNASGALVTLPMDAPKDNYDATSRISLGTSGVTANHPIPEELASRSAVNSYTTETAENGTYTLMVDPGTYDVEFSLVGYHTVTFEDVEVTVATSPVDVDAQMCEMAYPPSFVFADPNEADTEALITWGIPMGPYTIIYDDGTAENFFSFLPYGSATAVKFTPAGYPANVTGGRMFVGDGSFPEGVDFIGAQVSVGVIAADGTNGMPGTVLDSTTITVDNYGWVNFDNALNATIESGNFYIAVWKLLNQVPVGVDQNVPTYYRSYVKPAGGNWAASSYQDFMIRAIVDGPGTNVAERISGQMIYPSKPNMTEFVATCAPSGVPGVEKNGIYKAIENQEASRELVDYAVARINGFDPNVGEGPEDGTPTTIAAHNATQSYNDAGFGAQPAGYYAYAVRANYSLESSEWVYSNVVAHGLDNVVTLNVSRCDGGDVSGAEVHLLGHNYPFQHLMATTDASGVIVFDSVINGIYDLTANKMGFQPYEHFGILINYDYTEDVVLANKTYPAKNLFVEPLTSVATWEAPNYTAVEIQNFEDATFPPAGWAMESNSRGFFRTNAGGSSFWPIPAGDGYYACANDDGFNGDASIDRLILPVCDLREGASYNFAFDYFYDGSWGGSAYVEYSTDGGANWTVLQSLNAVGDWTTQSVSLASFAGEDALTLCFHYDDNGFWADGIAVDNVSVSNGAVDILGYEISLNNGYITEVGPEILTYEYRNLTYGQTYTATVKAKFPCGLSEPVNYVFQSTYLYPPRNIADAYVYNTNEIPMMWNPPVSVAGPARLSNVDNSPVTSVGVTSKGAIPAGLVQSADNRPSQYLNPLDSYNAWIEGPNGGTPATLYVADMATYGYTVVGNSLVDPSTGDFMNDEDTYMLCAGDWGATLYSVDVTTGASTLIAPFSGGFSDVSGMSVDRATNTMYVCMTSVSASQIGTLDVETGVITPIGSQTTEAPGLIQIAIDGSGQMYGWDIVNDATYLIDKTTGVVTYLGSLGFDANYGQGGNYSAEDGIIYLTAFNNSTFQGELRALDVTTGGTTFLGVLPQLQCTAFGVPASGSGGGGGGVPAGLVSFNLYQDGELLVNVPYEGQSPDEFVNYVINPIDPGTYSFDVSAVYDLSVFGFTGTGESAWEGTDVVTVAWGFPLPFNEDFAQGSFDFNHWSFNENGANWMINSQSGNGAPSAEFTWDPLLTDGYSSTLTSNPLLGDMITEGNIWLDFDLKLIDRNATGAEKMKVEVYNGSTWSQVALFSNEGSFDYTSNHINITAGAKGRVFKVRFNAIGENSFDVISWFVDNISIYRTCTPPTSLTGEYVYNGTNDFGAEVCWNGAAGTNVAEWLYYDDGVNVDGIGGPASFTWAVKFDPAQLEDFEGASLTKIKIYNRTAVANELRIYEGTNAATLLHTQTLSGLAVEAWAEVNLTSSVAIDITKQLWIAVYTDDGAAYPAGCGNGMNEPNGDLITLDGSTWEHLSDYALDYTWNLRGYVTTATGASVSIPMEKPQDHYNNDSRATLAISGLGSTGAALVETATRAIEGYNVYRKEAGGSYALVGNVPAVQGTTHYCLYDATNEAGIGYYYQVTAMYSSATDECESAPGMALVHPTEDFVYVLVTDINENEAGLTRMYPNPASESVTIESADMSRVTMMNAVGQVVYDATTNNASKVVLNTATYEAGVYVVRIQTSEGSVSKRVTIVR